NNFQELADDPNIGLRDVNGNGIPDLAYVTGTGAHDRISVVAGGGSAQVTVDAFNDAARTNSIRSFAYPINLLTHTDGPILVDAGLNDDRIEFDTSLAGNFRIRGGAGTDLLVLDAKNQPV